VTSSVPWPEMLANSFIILVNLYLRTESHLALALALTITDKEKNLPHII
jgi:hypothetical protein